MWPIFRVGKVLHFLNMAGMAGRSLWNVNQGYSGVKNLVNGGDGQKMKYLNPKERYDIIIYMEGIEIERQTKRNTFQLIEILTSLSHIPGMSIHVIRSAVPIWRTGKKRAISKQTEPGRTNP